MTRVLMLLAFFFAALPAYAKDLCGEGVFIDYHYPGSRSMKDKRVLAQYKHVISRAKVTEQHVPMLCEFDSKTKMPTAWAVSNTKEAPEAIPYQHMIFVPTVLKDHLSKMGLRAMLAHEVAHTVRTRMMLRIVQGESYIDMALKNEAATDILSARWVGKKAVLRGFKELEQIMLRYVRKEEHFYLQKQIAYRTIAVELADLR